jgi:hypothetical protein
VGQPATAKFRRLDAACLAAAKLEFQPMLDGASFADRPVNGAVHKKDGSWQPCGDCRQLNL